jgi:glycosyltransferase involved in cell wall biosynthesis
VSCLQGEVLFVPSTNRASGVVTYVSETCRALTLPCACLVEPGSDLDSALPAHCSRVATKAGRMAMARGLRRHWARFTYVESHGARGLLAARAAGVPRTRLGHVFHEPIEQQGMRGLVQLQLARGLRIAANAPGTAASVRSRIRTAVEVVPPIVPSAKLLSKEEAAQALGLGGDEFRIGVIGRLSAVKAPLLVLEAAALLGRRLRVVYIGNGPERGRIMRRARRLQVPVSLAGALPDAGSLLAAFDVVACPSPQESFGLTMAQAIVAERPVAAVDSAGARYVLGENGNFSAPTPAALATALDEALRASPESRARLRSSVLERFGSEQARDRIRAFYDHQVRPDRGPRRPET